MNSRLWASGAVIALALTLTMVTRPAAAQTGQPPARTASPLDLTPQQIQKAEARRQKFNQDIRAMGAKKGFTTDPQLQAFVESDPQAKALEKSYRADMLSYLSPAQRALLTKQQAKQEAFAKEAKDFTDSLTPTQHARMAKIHLDFQVAATKTESDTTLTDPQKQSKIMGLRKDNEAKLIALLTPAQRKQYLELEQGMMQGHP